MYSIFSFPRPCVCPPATRPPVDGAPLTCRDDETASSAVLSLMRKAREGRRSRNVQMRCGFVRDSRRPDLNTARRLVRSNRLANTARVPALVQKSARTPPMRSRCARRLPMRRLLPGFCSLDPPRRAQQPSCSCRRCARMGQAAAHGVKPTEHGCTRRHPPFHAQHEGAGQKKAQEQCYIRHGGMVL
jgi:hypothetical protein